MKKLSIILASLVALLTFAACEADKDPQYVAPGDDATFRLNTPAFVNHLYELTENGVMQLTCDAPDYGFIAITTYQLQISLTEAGLQERIPLNDNGKENLKELKTSQVVKTLDGTQAKMQVSEMLMAAALTTLYGAADESEMPEGAQKIWVRAVAHLEGVPSSYVYSNPVEITVMPYFRVREPGFLYLIGACNNDGNWIAPEEGNASKLEKWHVTERESGIDSGIYYGDFDIAAGQAIFRFYSALTGWDDDSLGSQKDDNPLEFTIDEAAEGLALVAGKGAFSFPDWEGGHMYIKVDTSAADMKVYMSMEPIDPVDE